MGKLNTGRKPVHLEQKGGKSNRQRVWEAIRKNKECFTLAQVSSLTDVHYDTVKTYGQALKRAGIIGPKSVHEDALVRDQAGSFSEHDLQLIQDCGVEAPALNRDGTPNSMGLGNEAMWRTLRMLPSVTVDELANFASASVATTRSTAQSYLKWLEKAGYVRHNNGRPRRYELIRARYTGPRPPQIQRIGQVYDPNTAEVAYIQTPEELL